MIRKIIEKIFCKHQWRRAYETFHHDDFGGSYHKVTFICNKCGKIKRFKS